MSKLVHNDRAYTFLFFFAVLHQRPYIIKYISLNKVFAAF